MNESNIIIKTKAIIGGYRHDAVQDMVNLANLTQTPVECAINGVVVLAFPGQTLDKVMEVFDPPEVKQAKEEFRKNGWVHQTLEGAFVAGSFWGRRQIESQTKQVP